MKVVQLPEWVKDHANLHAQSHVECELGILDPTDPAYEREYEKAFYKFCKEYYEHALIPAETEDSIKSSNPYTTPGKMAFDAFREDYFKNLFDTGKIPAEKREKAWQNLKAAAQTIERIFFDSKYGDYSFSHINVKDREKYLEVMTNRYLRLLLLSMILESVSHIYAANGDAIKNAVKKSLSKVRPADLNNRKKTIEKFVGAVSQSLERFSNQSGIRPGDISDYMIKEVEALEPKLASSSGGGQGGGMPPQLAEGLKKAKAEAPKKAKAEASKQKPSESQLREIMTDFAEQYVAAQGGRPVSPAEIKKAFEKGLEDFAKKKK